LTASSNIGNNYGNYKCLIHLDRLSITFRHWFESAFDDIRNPDFIPSEQKFNDISLIYDNSSGTGAFYHSFKVFYKGYLVGRLHTAAKLKKHEIQFDFAKEVFYSFYPGYWHEVYLSLMSELGITYNNIMYVEIAVDTDKNLLGQFAYHYINSSNNNLRLSDNFKMRKNAQVHAMNNGSSFLIGGTENQVAIYNKSQHAEQYIRDYFSNNGLDSKEIFRIESRLSWNYIRYLRNKKQLNIDADTLLDQGKLSTIFQVSTMHKITFMDMTSKSFDDNRNPQYQKVSIVDDLLLESAEIGRLNQSLQITHYKNESVDENILRQNYYRFLETGHREYLQNFNASGHAAGLNKIQMLGLISKFNCKYKGNRTIDIIERMDTAKKHLSTKLKNNLMEVFYALQLKLMLQLQFIGLL
jgi:hypothetical protein